MHTHRCSHASTLTHPHRHARSHAYVHVHTPTHPQGFPSLGALSPLHVPTGASSVLSHCSSLALSQMTDTCAMSPWVVAPWFPPPLALINPLPSALTWYLPLKASLLFALRLKPPGRSWGEEESVPQAYTHRFVLSLAAVLVNLALLQTHPELQTQFRPVQEDTHWSWRGGVQS